MSNDEQDPEKRLLARHGLSFAAGDVLFRDQDVADRAFLLQEGRVRLIKRVGGVERGIRILHPGDLFGESSLIPGARRSSTAIALTGGSAVALPPRAFQQAMGQNPAVATRVVQQLARRLRDAEDHIEILMVSDPLEKVVVALLKLAQQAAGELETVGTSVELSLSPTELSARTGVDVDVVKRCVARLRESGHVQIVNERVEVSNLTAMRELLTLLDVRDAVGRPNGGV